nr:salicylic acid methyltransferase [Geranium robertianum]
MGLEQHIRMKSGDVESSYANNSLLQRTLICMVKPILETCAAETYCRLSPECFRVADLGCSSGPNTLLVLSEIIHTIAHTSLQLNRTPPSLHAFLNDLYVNDFNTLFMSLPAFYDRLQQDCFVSATPGSFYGRLFPANSIHFVHSSSAVMWLSKVPSVEAMNKGDICITKASPPAVVRAYFEQFQRDFTLFLKLRAKEVVPGGSMVLTKLGSVNSNDPLSIWEVIGLNLGDMVLEGVIEGEKLDSFNVPCYNATEEEVRKLIEEQGSFTLQSLETVTMEWDAYIKQAYGDDVTKAAREEILTATVRAALEPILAAQFGESVMDELFRRFQGLVIDHMEAHNCHFVNLVMCLTKKP